MVAPGSDGWTRESAAKGQSEIQNRVVFDCACDGHFQTGGAYAEGEEWGDFLGPGFGSTPSSAFAVIGGHQDLPDLVHLLESYRGPADSDRLLAKKIQAEWSEVRNSKWQSLQSNQ